MIILETIAYFVAFLFLCVTYFYLTAVAVTFGTKAALISWMKEINFVPANMNEASVDTETLEEFDPDTAELLRKIRGED